MIEVRNIIKGFKLTDVTKQIVDNEYMLFVNSIVNIIKSCKFSDSIVANINSKQVMTNRLDPDNDFVGFDPLAANIVPLYLFIEFDIKSNNGRTVSDLNSVIDNYDIFNIYFENVIKVAVSYVFEDLDFSYETISYGKNKRKIAIYTKDNTMIEVIISIPFMDYIEADRNKFDKLKYIISMKEGGYLARASMSIDIVTTRLDKV